MRGLILTGGLAVLGATMAAGQPADQGDWKPLSAQVLPENTWVKVSPGTGRPSPKFGWEGSGDIDPAANLWIHHGGHDSNPQGFITFTWDLVTGQWRQRFPNTAPPGVCCVDGGNVFDPANGRFVRFPGGSMGHGWQWSRRCSLSESNAWLYDAAANTWTNMRPLPYKEPGKYAKDALGGLDGCATFDPNHNLAVRFGGQNSAGESDFLHVYDAHANTLTRLDPEGGKPSARDGSGLAYDSDADCLVMFGSQYDNDERTWVYDYKANKWAGHDLSPRPPGRKDKNTYSTIPKMAYSPRHKLSLCVVWLDKGGHQTWAFDKAAMKWTELKPAAEAEPTLSRARNLSFWAAGNIFLMETMTAKGEAQMWAYRLPGPIQARPRGPADLAVVTEAGKATLTWKQVTGGKSFNVYRGQADQPWKLDMKKAASVPAPRMQDAPTWEDAAVEPGKVTYYAVRAVGPGDVEGQQSFLARTQPRVPASPAVSVLAADKVEVNWPANAEKDVAGYNVYRGVATVGTVKARGKGGKWVENSPGYPEPAVSRVRDVTGIEKLNAEPLTGTSLTDAKVNLAKPGPESGDYKFAVCAYIVRAVNKLGVESGPSPYALTIPSAPTNVLARETAGGAEVKWSPSPEKSIAGYLVHRMDDQYSVAEQITPKPIKETTLADKPDGRARYFIVAVDALGQQGEPSAPAWSGWSYKGFFDGDWHQ